MAEYIAYPLVFPVFWSFMFYAASAKPSNESSFVNIAQVNNTVKSKVLKQEGESLIDSLIEGDLVCSLSEERSMRNCYNGGHFEYRDKLTIESEEIVNLTNLIFRSYLMYAYRGYSDDFTKIISMLSFGPPIVLYPASRLAAFPSLSDDVMSALADTRTYGQIMEMLNEHAMVTRDAIENDCHKFVRLTSCFEEIFNNSECSPMQYRVYKVISKTVCDHDFQSLILNQSNCLIAVAADVDVEICLAGVNKTALDIVYDDLDRRDYLCSITDRALECIRPVSEACGPNIFEIAKKTGYITMSTIFNIDCYARNTDASNSTAKTDL